MSEIPPSGYSAPPAAAPAKRGLPTWAIVLIVVLVLCLCVTCILAVVIGSPAISGGMAGGQVVFVCMDRGYSAEVCGEWSQEVSTSPEFQACAADLMAQGNLTGEALFDCMVEKGMGPE